MEVTQPHSASLPWIIAVAPIPASILLTTTPTLISHNIFLKCKTLLKSPMTFNLTLGKSQSSYTTQGPTLPTHLPPVLLLLLSSLLTGLLDASQRHCTCRSLCLECASHMQHTVVHFWFAFSSALGFWLQHHMDDGAFSENFKWGLYLEI